MTELAEFFGAEGALAQHLPGFTHRDAQEAMATLIWQAVQEREHLVVEAGTGIGKTFAYLAPLLLAGRRAVISTGTKTLQDQLFARDLPALGAAIGLLLIIESIGPFVNPRGSRRMFLTAAQIPDKQLRWIGAIGMALGLLILSIARA